MEPIEYLIISAISSFIIRLFIHIAILIIDDIIKWFDEITHKTSHDVGFTVANALSNGDYKVVQGVFNKQANKITTARQIDTQKLDSKLEGYHRNHKVVIYS